MKPPTEGAVPERKKQNAFRTRRPGTAPRKGDAPSNESVKKEKKQPSKLFREYYGILFLLLLAVFVALGYYALNPLYTEFKELNTEIEVQLQTLEDERTYLDSLERSIAAAESIPQETLARVDEALPEEINLPKLLITMSTIASENGVGLTSVQFTTTGEPKRSERTRRASAMIELIPLDVNMSIDSPGYRATRSFLEDLESNVRVLDVSTISVTGNEQDGTMTYTLDLTAYAVRKPERKIPPPGGVLPDQESGIPL